MNIKEFNNVSIRGRMAYGICCLENALCHYDLWNEGWHLLLEKLWSFTSVGNDPIFISKKDKLFKTQLDNWFHIVEYLPSSILEFNSYHNSIAEDYDILTEEEFDLLHKTYQEANDVLNSIVEYLFQIGSEELYNGIVNFSSQTMRFLQQIIELMNMNGISLPKEEPFKQYKFSPKGKEDYSHGWGETFDGKQYSRFLNK